MTCDEIGGVIGAPLLLAGMALLFYRIWGRHMLELAGARQALPALAQELGLRHRQPRDPKQIGVLSGIYDGYRVKIDPDSDFEKITIRLRFDSSLHLSMNKREGEMDSFDAPRLNRFFRTRQASPELLQKMHERLGRASATVADAGAGYRSAAGGSGEQTSAVELLDTFVKQWKGKLKRFNLSNSEIQLTPTLGAPDEAAQSLSATQVRTLLPQLVAIARAIDGLAPPGLKERDEISLD